MRYFFISFVHRTLNNGHGYASTSMKSETFPNLKTLEEAIVDELPTALKPIVIINIIEFQSEQDYLNFIQ